VCSYDVHGVISFHIYVLCLLLVSLAPVIVFDCFCMSFVSGVECPAHLSYVQSKHFLVDATFVVFISLWVLFHYILYCVWNAIFNWMFLFQCM
jgi:hypothetical protein